MRENILGPGRVTDEDYAWFVAHGPVWVWDDGTAILGFSAGDPRDGSVWALFVHPDHEGHGIGSALLTRACDSLAAAGHRAATLETAAGTRAEGFYLRQGWVTAGLDPEGQRAFRRTLDRRP